MNIDVHREHEAKNRSNHFGAHHSSTGASFNKKESEGVSYKLSTDSYTFINTAFYTHKKAEDKEEGGKGGKKGALCITAAITGACWDSG